MNENHELRDFCEVKGFQFLTSYQEDFLTLTATPQSDHIKPCFTSSEALVSHLQQVS